MNDKNQSKRESSNHSEIDVAGFYEPELNRALSPYLLGDQSDLNPLPQDSLPASHYVRLRKENGDSELSSNWDAEEAFHDVFWPKSGNGGAQLIVLTGGEGEGKTTFLRYYFQYFLPYYWIVGRLPPIDISNADWQSGLCRHVFLFIDIQHDASNESLISHICKSFRHQLEIRFPGISTENNYAFWDSHVGGWDSKIHRDARPKGVPLDKYRASIIVNRNLDADDSAWLSSALIYLSNKGTSPNRPCYITFVFDNCDQMPEDVQGGLLKWIFQYIRRDVEHADSLYNQVWRIVVPMRPETVSSLMPQLTPMGNKVMFSLGKVDQDELILQRKKYLDTLIIDGGRIMDLHRSQGGDKPVYTPYLAEQAARCLSETLDSAYDTDTTEFIGGLKGRQKDVTLLLGNGAPRRILAIKSRIARSRIARQHFQESGSGSGMSRFNYFTALLLGSKGYYDKHEDGNYILNVYDCGVSNRVAHSMLIGLHALHLFSGGGSWSRVRERLLAIGYLENELDECRNELINKRVLKNYAEYQAKETDFRAEENIVRGHLQLSIDAAYTDVMAESMYTKLKLPSECFPTDPMRYEDLGRRVDGALHFFRALKQAEEDVASYKVVAHLGIDKARFRADFNQMALPRQWKLAGLTYATRLLSLAEKLDHDSPFSRHVRLNDPWWKDIVHKLTVLENEINKTESATLKARVD